MDEVSVVVVSDINLSLFDLCEKLPRRCVNPGSSEMTFETVYGGTLVRSMVSCFMDKTPFGMGR